MEKSKVNRFVKILTTSDCKLVQNYMQEFRLQTCVKLCATIYSRQTFTYTNNAWLRSCKTILWKNANDLVQSNFIPGWHAQSCVTKCFMLISSGV